MIEHDGIFETISTHGSSDYQYIFPIYNWNNIVHAEKYLISLDLTAYDLRKLRDLINQVIDLKIETFNQSRRISCRCGICLVQENISRDKTHDRLSDSNIESEDRKVIFQEDPNWKHQDQAIKKFLDVKHGILEMATGTGKTRTALKIADHLLKNGEIRHVIVIGYGNDLLEQWRIRLVEWFENPYQFAYFGSHKDFSMFTNKMDNNPTIFVTSYQNIAKLLKQKRLSYRSETFLICDEVHHLGSEGLRNKIGSSLQDFPWRIGLSATPERAYDEEGVQYLQENLGKVFFEFSLKDAIKTGIVKELRYIPLPYQFSDEDNMALQQAYSNFYSKQNKGKSPSKTELYVQLARVRKLSENKINVFQAFLDSGNSSDDPYGKLQRETQQKEDLGERTNLLNQSLIFVEEKEYGMKVQSMLLDYHDDFHTYYAGDDVSVLVDFKFGETKCLITAKKISEGIDIENINTIVLFTASRNKRETIQRIGRALRQDGSNSEPATIIDFIREDDLTDTDGEFEATDKIRYEWLVELSQVKSGDING